MPSQTPEAHGRRFLTRAEVAKILNISDSQTYALVRNGDLPAIKIGGRGQWRVEWAALESYIQRMYIQTRDYVDAHPLVAGSSDSTEDPGGPASGGTSAPASLIRSGRFPTT